MAGGERYSVRMSIPQLWWGTIPLPVTVAFIVVDFTIRIVALGVVPINRRPSAAWGWLLAIFFLPILGLLVFLLLGRSNLPRHRKEKQRKIAELVRHDDPARYAIGDTSAVPDWALDAARLNHENSGLPLIAGNDAQLFDDYTESLEAMTRAVRRVESYVHFAFYIVAADKTTDPLITALEDAHRRGVTVRVLIDHIGSLGFPGYAEVVRRLDRSGIPWRRMLPVRPWRLEYQRPDLRNHRKILVVDGTEAFTGSQNIIDASYNKKKNLREHLQWRDLMLRLEGPAVHHLNAVFIVDWYSETDELLANETATVLPDSSGGGLLCQVLPSGPGLDNESNLRLFNHLFYSARSRIIVSSPYFVPDESMLGAITTAAQRGVDVRLYMGGTSDHALTHHAQRSYYEMLMKAGVKILLYESPYILHSKFVLIDDEVAVIASSNMDIRSFTLNLEVNLMVCDEGFVSRMMAVVRKYRDASSPLELESWLERPGYQKFFDNVSRLTAGVQ